MAVDPVGHSHDGGGHGHDAVPAAAPAAKAPTAQLGVGAGPAQVGGRAPTNQVAWGVAEDIFSGRAAAKAPTLAPPAFSFNAQEYMRSQFVRAEMRFSFGIDATFGAYGPPLPPPSPPLDISETALDHCGYVKGTKNTLTTEGGFKVIEEGHDRISVKAADGKNFLTLDSNRCANPPVVEIHAAGDKAKKALYKIPMDKLKDGTSIDLPDGTKMLVKGDNTGIKNIEVTQGDQVATIETNKNDSWKIKGEGDDKAKAADPAKAAEAPKPPALSLSLGADLKTVTEGGAAGAAQGGFGDPRLQGFGGVGGMGGLGGGFGGRLGGDFGAFQAGAYRDPRLAAIAPGGKPPAVIAGNAAHLGGVSRYLGGMYPSLMGNQPLMPPMIRMQPQREDRLMALMRMSRLFEELQGMLQQIDVRRGRFSF